MEQHISQIERVLICLELVDSCIRKHKRNDPEQISDLKKERDKLINLKRLYETNNSKFTKAYDLNDLKSIEDKCDKFLLKDTEFETFNNISEKLFPLIEESYGGINTKWHDIIKNFPFVQQNVLNFLEVIRTYIDVKKEIDIKNKKEKEDSVLTPLVDYLVKNAYRENSLLQFIFKCLNCVDINVVIEALNCLTALPRADVEFVDGKNYQPLANFIGEFESNSIFTFCINKLNKIDEEVKEAKKIDSANKILLESNKWDEIKNAHDNLLRKYIDAQSNIQSNIKSNIKSNIITPKIKKNC